MQKNKVLFQISNYLLVILLVLNHSVYYYMNPTKNILQIGIIIATFVALICMPNYRIQRSYIYRAIVVLIVALLLLASGWVGQDKLSFIVRYVYFIPLMILIFASCKENEKYVFFYHLSDIISLLAVFSLVLWFMGSILHIIPATGIVKPEWGKVDLGNGEYGAINYLYLYFDIQVSPTSIPNNIIPYRNCGIFCEGPAYAFILSIALITELFLRENKKNRVILLICTLISTMTTSSMMYLALFGVLRWFISKRYFNRRKKICIIPGAIFIFIIFIMILLKYKSNTNSVEIRLNDYINGFRTFVTSPLIGYGYSFEAFSVGAGITNSLSDTLVRGGCVYTLYYLGPVLGNLLQSLKMMIKKGNRVECVYDKECVLMVWILCAYCTTILTYTFILLTLITYAYIGVERQLYNENSDKTYII